MKRSPIRKKSNSPEALCKERIQALCRQIGLIRDKGCVMRFYPESGACGGYRKDGGIIYQFDHLNSRIHAVSFGDPRLGVILCQRHHIYWKPQEPNLFISIVRKHIGPVRAALLDKVQLHRWIPQKMDWKLVELGLIQELKKLS